VDASSHPGEALAVMVANHIRHIVVVNEAGSVVGMASARHIFQAQVESLDDAVRSLESFVGSDGPGG
jgi:CBS domain-containing protein